MSSAIVRACISGILEDEDFSLDTPRMQLAKQTATRILELTRKSSPQFESFAKIFLEKLQPSGETFGSRARKKMWSQFHEMRGGELEELWLHRFSSLGLEPKFTVDPLFRQYVNEKALENIIESKLSSDSTASKSEELSSDELNVLRFVAGYVSFKLTKKIDKGAHPYKKEFLLCLSRMSEEKGNCEDSFALYSKRWMQLIDRGGLYHINDSVYVFFHSIEYEVKRHLRKLSQDGIVTEDSITDEVINDVDVQYHWSSIAADIDGKAAQMLLKKIVTLWLNVRGFSEVGAYMEEYKNSKHKATKKAASLRKGLKRKRMDGGSTSKKVELDDNSEWFELEDK